MCALRPGIPGLSENIRVRSIIGRFLEHSRIFFFANGGPYDGDESEIFCGSADWMSRNLHERCEVVFPVADPAAKRRLRDEILAAYLHDNLKARIMNPDGTYGRAPKSGPALSSQQQLMELSRSPEKRRSREVNEELESTPAEEAESILSKEQSAL
jgi:polyphosphate kinase